MKMQAPVDKVLMHLLRNSKPVTHVTFNSLETEKIEPTRNLSLGTSVRQDQHTTYLSSEENVSNGSFIWQFSSEQKYSLMKSQTIF